MRLVGGLPGARSPCPLLRITPLLLCAPPTPRPDLTIDVITATSLRERFDVPPPLEVALRQAWQRSWQEQADEIAKLETMDEETMDEDEPPALNLRQLWSDTDNSTEAVLAERRQRARSVAQELMLFWRSSTPRTDKLADKIEEYDLAFDAGVTAEAALKERRRQLMRHAAAGQVEYRIFGEVLSRDEAVLELLPEAGLVPFEEAWRQLGGFANLTGWLEDDDFEDELSEALRDISASDDDMFESLIEVRAHPSLLRASAETCSN
jgi:hypothetical protein